MATFDLMVIGSGSGGYVAALRAAQLGAAVALVEERELGGVCLNRGCIPTKAVLESARVLGALKRAEQFGLKSADVEVDYPAVIARKEKVVARLRRGLAALLKGARVEVVGGHAKILDAHTIEVTERDSTRKIEGKNIVVATGSEPARPRVFPFDGSRVITSDDALGLTELPESVLIVGGGYIGCEFASMWSELGSKVTLVEMLPALLPQADQDVSKEMQRVLMRKRVKVHVGTKIERMTTTPGGVTAELGEGRSVEAAIALVAVGRKLNGDLAGLKELGVQLQGDAIGVDEFGRTNVEGVYAVGDVTGKCLLAHYASEQGVVAAEHLFGGSPEPIDERAVPSCVFTIPEIASVGLSEAEARRKLTDVRVGRFDMTALGKASASGETTGFVKVIGDGNDTVVGVHMVGHEVTSMIAEAALAVRMKLKMNDIVHTIHAHPTMPEAFHEAALDFFARAIHKL
ncbi:MAG: hypothetical protein AMK75_04660 [Planctomycetes bacterium SM23_65]|nr:MAG: hypothetical protein AMK75_04660 [Planctomycetes bacterium SM23_65]